jgi:hypothetical protein
MPDERIKIYNCAGVREAVEFWCRKRGGVRIWLDPEANPENPYRDATYAPNLGVDGKSYQPLWAEGRKSELVTDIARFHFAKSMREIKRIKLPCEPLSDHPFSIRLTAAGRKKMKVELAKAEPEATYHFDYSTNEWVIEVPVWEEEEVPHGK